MSKAESVIRFQAQVWAIKTLVDGGINVTLALSEDTIKQVSEMLECKRRGAILEIAAVPIESTGFDTDAFGIEPVLLERANGK